MLWQAIPAPARPPSRKLCFILQAHPIVAVKLGEGNTVCDSDPEEIRRKTSVSTAVAPFEWKNKKINLLDTPGLFDFQGGLYEAARAAESVVIVLAGKSSISVGTEKAFAAAEKRMPRFSS